MNLARASVRRPVFTSMVTLIVVVLGAMGLSHLETNSSIRVSLSRFNTKKEVEYFLETLLGVVDKLREMSPVKLKNV